MMPLAITVIKASDAPIRYSGDGETDRPFDLPSCGNQYVGQQQTDQETSLGAVGKWAPEPKPT
jgi:hypothetical protein